MERIPFGTYIRQLRETQQMPLRKLAAALDIDTSTLSKIERQERYANSTMVPIIAKVFDLEYKELQIFFWKDKLLHELKEEDFIIEALEQTIEQLTKEE
ncbi:MAG: helix-turn-helix transcriptional regulator [Saprospiraceae bacterium]